MKQLTISLHLIAIKLIAFPDLELLAIVFITLLIDFITGVVKSVVVGKERNSKGYRESITKLVQYTGAIVTVMLLGALANFQGIFTNIEYLSWIKDGVCCFIVFIEVTSILENIYAVDKKSMLSKYFIQPLLRVMTFQIKNNNLVMQARQDAEINNPKS